ncbi:hypothetical protein C8Q80DRAFT_1296322 [Daedaleopsis nitida]|nr:hypothetical protein C8Q80DRAFT_1296322 [Daedaleopsis nitida]
MRPIFYGLSDFIGDYPEPRESASTAGRIPATPWAPFHTRFDFDFAYFALDAGLTKAQVNTLLSLIRRLAPNTTELTFRSYKDLRDAWKKAESKQPAFKMYTVPVKYIHQTVRTYHVWSRNLWDWALNLIRDPILAKRMVWNATKQYKYINGVWERFIDEPHTANIWWDMETALPNDVYPVMFILYADKTKLSSFGSQKGYPVVARLANLPCDVRNGDGYGGGQVVGFLPIVSVEDSNEEGKLSFTTHKRAVWHESFWVILQAISSVYDWGSGRGQKFPCGDGIERVLYPKVLILSGDYEEQCMMSLIRGAGGIETCPVCHVPQDKQHILGTHNLFPLRTNEEGQFIVNQEISDTRKNILLGPKGLRPLQNVFWRIEEFDLHKALSWDRLHAYHGGLFSDHLFDEFQKILAGTESLRNDRIRANTQFDHLPRWRDFNHFVEVVSVNFADGSKYEDISKVIVPCAYNILPLENRRWYLLMKLNRHYIILDVYAGMKRHTTITLTSLREMLPKFSQVVEEYKLVHKKNWDFPKAHSHQHEPDDIENKGVTRNFNTKPSEHSHHALKTIYQTRTNFKHVEQQIANIEHNFLVAKGIRHLMDALDGPAEVDDDAVLITAEDLDEDWEDTNPFQFGQVMLGSRDAHVSFAFIEQSRSDDHAFSTFRTGFNAFLEALGVVGKNKSKIVLKPTDQIIQSKYLKVYYNSEVTWEETVDYLRCNPSFHNTPRYDCVMFLVDKNTVKFGRLKEVFVYETSAAELIPSAFLELFEVVVDTPRSTIDIDLGLCRVRSSGTIFIHAESIVRGAYIIPDFGDAAHRDYFVVDVIDDDMFLRCKKHFGTIWST